MTDFSTWDRATLEQFAQEATDKLVSGCFTAGDMADNAAKAFRDGEASNRAAIAELVGALQDMMEYAGIIEERCDSVATDAARAAITKHTTTTKEGN